MALNSDENENHWPGYVDALTTMTMVLTFVMMVLGIAIFTLSQNVSRGFLDSIAGAVKVSTDPETTSQEEIARLVISRIEALKGDQAARSSSPAPESALPGDVIASRSDPARETPAAPVRMEGDQTNLRLVFRPRATTLDEESRSRLAERLQGLPVLAEIQRIEIRAGFDQASAAVSDGRRVAFYRAMKTRGELMQSGVPAGRIHVLVDPHTPGDDVLILVKP